MSYVFGLSEGNIVRLRQGKPIAIDLEPLGGSGQVMIMWGQTEEAIVAELQAVQRGDAS